jgi:ABC-type amino acid transport substrate-binding protein
MGLTLQPGTLVVASAYPDPPFDLMENGSATGFDIELMRAVCGQLGLRLQPVPYSGDDFNGIFEGLAKRNCDAVISGTTITPERAAIVKFSEPYLEFNQGIAVNAQLTPNVSSTGDLRGLSAGIQSGNTSDIVARRLRGKVQLQISGIMRTTASLLPLMISRREELASSSSCFR